MSTPTRRKALPEEWDERYMKLPPRGRKLAASKLWRKHPRVQRRPHTEDEIKEMVLKNRILTFKSLMDFIRANPDAPHWREIKRYFGTWNNLKQQALGIGPKKARDDEEILRVLIENHVWTVSQLVKCKKKEPRLFVSYKTIRKRFGNWDIVKKLLMARTKASIIERYLLLKDELGRFPTLKECGERRVEVRNLMNSMGRDAFLALVLELERKIKSNENRE